MANDGSFLGLGVARYDDDGNVIGLVKKSQTVAFGEFTDSTGVTGTFELTDKVPVGAIFLGCALTALTGFAGDTSATITVGDGTDVDRYMTGTPDVFTTIAAGLALGIPSGVKYHAVEKTIKITITAATDWGAVTAGALTIEFFYLT